MYKGGCFRSPPYTYALRTARIPPTHPEYALLGFRGPKQKNFPPSPLQQKGELKPQGLNKLIGYRFANVAQKGS